MPYLDSVASRSRFVITWVSELLNGIIKGLLRPSSTSILIASVVDLTRSKPDLIAENTYWARLARPSRRCRQATRTLESMRRSNKLCNLAIGELTWFENAIGEKRATGLVSLLTIIGWHGDRFGRLT